MVVVLLAVSFITSTLMHYQLYRLRRNAALVAQTPASGLNDISRSTLDQADLEALPIKPYARKTRRTDTVETLVHENGETDNQDDSATDQGDTLQNGAEAIISPAVAAGDKRFVYPQPTDMDDQVMYPTLPGSSPSIRPRLSFSIPTTQLTLDRPHRCSLDNPRRRTIDRCSNHTHIQTPLSPLSTTFTPCSNPPEAGSDTCSMISMCAICLDDYTPGIMVRELPCHHEFHVDCVDRWLTERRGECPLCKSSVKARLMEDAAAAAAASAVSVVSADSTASAAFAASAASTLVSAAAVIDVSTDDSNNDVSASATRSRSGSRGANEAQAMEMDVIQVRDGEDSVRVDIEGDLSNLDRIASLGVTGGSIPRGGSDSIGNESRSGSTDRVLSGNNMGIPVTAGLPRESIWSKAFGRARLPTASPV